MKPEAETTAVPLAVIGVDLGKDVFHLVGLGVDGRIAFRKKIRRLALRDAFEKLPPCIVGMEACLSAHFVSRVLRALGHEPRIIPAIYVKPFVKGQKNDYNDAEAIAEAALRPNLRFVQEKTQDQLDLQACHRVRSRLVSRRTATINQIRAFLIEQGIAVRTGPRALRNSLFAILENRKDEISPRMIKLILGPALSHSADVIRALVCGYPQSKWPAKLMVMLQAFVDDSASETGDRRLFLAGYIDRPMKALLMSEGAGIDIDAATLQRHARRLRRVPGVRFVQTKPAWRETKKATLAYLAAGIRPPEPGFIRMRWHFAKRRLSEAISRLRYPRRRR